MLLLCKFYPKTSTLREISLKFKTLALKFFSLGRDVTSIYPFVLKHDDNRLHIRVDSAEILLESFLSIKCIEKYNIFFKIIDEEV